MIEPNAKSFVMNFFKVNCILFFVVRSFIGYAQKIPIDSSKQLNIVEVSASKIKLFASGTKVKTIDSVMMVEYQTSNLADLLSAQNAFFIKSYGLGGLATTSFRGGSASHTAVLWNGFNLNSPMNGLLDLSLVPNSFINDVAIQYGGTSALWGSGAVGGAIHLNNTANFDKGIKASIGITIGSFGDYRQHVSIEYSGKKNIFSIKLFNHTAQNNFPFYNTTLKEQPRQFQSNAELKQYGLLCENYFRINKHQKINARFWYQNNNRNLPPTMLQQSNLSNQKDETYRFTSEWQRTSNKIVWLIRAAYFDEHLIYSDIAHDYISLNRSQSIIAETEARITLSKNHLFNIGVNNTFLKAVTDGYSYRPHENRTAGFLSYNFQNNKKNISTTLSARQEVIQNKKAVPFTYSAGLDWQIIKQVGVKIAAAKVYRTPTFNDLYWTPGGNPHLLSESGYSEEAGLKFNFFSKKLKTAFVFEPTVFNRTMKNWIIWLPQSNYWAPQNIMEVWSRGMETTSELKIETHGFQIKLNVLTNYVVSTNQKAKSTNDASVNKQLIYTPMYSGKASLSLQYKGFCLSYNHTYTGYRYTATDNKNFLEPYQMASIYFSKKLIRKSIDILLFVQANNIYNEQYQIIQSRAMPLLNYQGGISIQFNQHKLI